MLLFPIVLCVGLLVLYIATGWRIFQKAGRPGWEAIIPIYNLLIFLKIVGKPWWWIFLMCVPAINWVFTIWTFNMFSKSFGKSEGFTALLFFFSFIFFPVIAFGDAEYQGPFGDPEAYAAYQARKKGAFDFENNIFSDNRTV